MRRDTFEVFCAQALHPILDPLADLGLFARFAAGCAQLVLVVPPPPLVRRCLGISFLRILPVFLAAERRQIEKRPDAAQRLDATDGGEIRAIGLVAIAQEYAEAERLAVLVLVYLRLLRPDFEVRVEVALV